MLPRRWLWLAPLAHASAAISEGLARRALQRKGMLIEERVLAGAVVPTYILPGPAEVPPIVLIHGLGSSAMSWSQLMPLLQGSATIYALDLPGFGLSPLPDDAPPYTFRRHVEVVLAFLEQVVGRPAVLVGNSMGGWLTLHSGLLRPDLCAALVPLNPAGVLLEAAQWQSTRSLFQPASFADVRRFYRALFGRVPLPIYLSQPETMRRLWRRSVQSIIETADEADFLKPDQLQALQPPTTVVWGMADRLLPLVSLEVLRGCLPRARWVLLPNCGHLPQIEQPRRVASCIAEVLAELVPGSAAQPQSHPLVV